MKRMNRNEDAVSPVIGVILMVAITVILAAVVGAFVFGMQPTGNAPLASLQITEATGEQFKLEHGGGDVIEWNTTKMFLDGSEITGTPTTGNLSVAQFEIIAVPHKSGDEVTIVDTESSKLISKMVIRV